MSKEISIIGAGGHTRSLISLIEALELQIKGIYDESYNAQTSEEISGYRLLGTPENIQNGPLVLSIGDNQKRTQWFRNLEKMIYHDELLHPKAIIDKEAILKGYNQVFSGVIINAHACIGKNNIINTGAIIEHEVLIGDHNHISVGAIICGRVHIGSQCFFGAGSVIIDKLSIADNVIIGANSVVISDIIEAGTYVGNPARRVK